MKLFRHESGLHGEQFLRDRDVIKIVKRLFSREIRPLFPVPEFAVDILLFAPGVVQGIRK